MSAAWLDVWRDAGSMRERTRRSVSAHERCGAAKSRRLPDHRSSSPFGVAKGALRQHFLRQFRRSVVNAAHKGRLFAGLFQLAYNPIL